MALKVEIVLDGQQVLVNWPQNQPMHALKMLESARQAIEQKLLQAEQQPQIELPTSELAQKLRNGRG